MNVSIPRVADSLDGPFAKTLLLIVTATTRQRKFEVQSLEASAFRTERMNANSSDILKRTKRKKIRFPSSLKAQPNLVINKWVLVGKE